MINTVCLTGRITKDLELRSTQSGTSLCSFNLAVERQKDKNGNQVTDFINCQAWGKTAEVMSQYLSKGSLIGVEGRIQTRNYENAQGQRVYVTEVLVNRIHFLESKRETAPNPYVNQHKNNNAQNPYQQNQQVNIKSYAGSNYQPQSNPQDDIYGIDTDDLPF